MQLHDSSSHAAMPQAAIELRFVSRKGDGRALSFPCDADGRVDMDRLDAKRRNDYFFARALMGRDFAFPIVAVCG